MRSCTKRIRSWSGTARTDRRKSRHGHPFVSPIRGARCPSGEAGTLRPTLGDCKALECNNVVLTADNIAALHAERATLLDELAKQPTLPPMLHHRLTARAEAIAAFIARHNNRS
jgi:hypothetical protein